jgi:hypothetical protein
MGILYPASAAVYLPFAANIFQWFNKYIGLAGGTMICGTGIGGSSKHKHHHAYFSLTP